MTPNATFNSIDIGDFAWLEISFSNELEVRKIPRADGCIVRRRGGGEQILTVHAYVTKTTRANFEQYFKELPIFFGSGSHTLTVNGIDYTNTLFISVSPGGDYKNFTTFTVIFRRSGE